jgi:hypothetical protein
MVLKPGTVFMANTLFFHISSRLIVLLLSCAFKTNPVNKNNKPKKYRIVQFCEVQKYKQRATAGNINGLVLRKIIKIVYLR